MLKVCILGLGYIGLPTAALLANKGFNIHGVDKKDYVVETINQGKVHIVEPDLDAFVKSAVGSGRLKAYLKPSKADIFIIAVPTPFKEKHVPDISYVEEAVSSIVPFVEENNCIILESTSPVGTTEKISKIICDLRSELCGKIFVAHCPERVLPGKIMRELIENDRIVGGLTKEATEKVANFYKKFVKGNVIKTDAKTAELCKLVENSFRDVNIAFANELSLICDELKIDVWELISLANRHPRVNILRPGTGVGGHCIAVDPWFIVHQSPESAKIIKTAREVNLYKTEWVLEKIKNVSLNFEKENGRKAKIACLGIAFKPDIDDLRESAALNITKRLKDEGFDLFVVEPNIKKHPDFRIHDFETAVENADIIAILVEHKEFKKMPKFEGKIFLNFCGLQ